MVSRFRAQTTADGLHSSDYDIFFFGLFLLVIPVLIPVGKNLHIPDILNTVFAHMCFMVLLKLFSSLLSSSNQYSFDIVHPLSSFFIGLSLEIKSPMDCLNCETQGIKLLRNFIFFHDS